MAFIYPCCRVLLEYQIQVLDWYHANNLTHVMAAKYCGINVETLKAWLDREDQLREAHEAGAETFVKYKADLEKQKANATHDSIPGPPLNEHEPVKDTRASRVQYDDEQKEAILEWHEKFGTRMLDTAKQFKITKGVLSHWIAAKKRKEKAARKRKKRDQLIGIAGASNGDDAAAVVVGTCEVFVYV